ncbi:MAG: hydrolase [Pseudomonadota bacterium]
MSVSHIDRQRAAVVREALSWLRTPYHHHADVKGAGADCIMLLIRVYHACGLIPDVDPRPYPHDWHLHRDEERYLDGVLRYARPVKQPQPGDVALYRFGRCISHGAIVTRWPQVVHAYLGQGVILSESDQPPLAGRLAGFYSLWGD